MQKFLFTDGTNGVREVQSKEELENLIRSSSFPDAVRIWIYDSHQWINIARYRTLQPAPVPEAAEAASTGKEAHPQRKPLPGLFRKTLVGAAGIALILLVYNFTRVTWTKASPLAIVAERPANTPVVDADSLIATIELLRGQKMDKVTRTNLRIRNTWPDLVQLQLTADRDSSREGSRFYNAAIAVDNATGYLLDQALVKIELWENEQVQQTDTLKFSNISYATPAVRKLEKQLRGDSLSISFLSIRSRAFNFCYSADKKSNYGNYNDRWFCR